MKAWKRKPRSEILMLCAIRLERGQSITTRWMADTYGLPKPTAVRYMTEIECCLPVHDIGTQKARELTLMRGAL